MEIPPSLSRHPLLAEPDKAKRLQNPSSVVLVVKKPPANARDVRDMGLIPGSGRSPGERNDNPEETGRLQTIGSDMTELI